MKPKQKMCFSRWSGSARPLARLLIFTAPLILPLTGGAPRGPQAVSASDSYLRFAPEQRLGQSQKNPAAPFLRASPRGRLYAIWTEDHEVPGPDGKGTAPHGTAPATAIPHRLRNALVAWSEDGGKTWSPAKRVNDQVEAVQAEENGPKIAFGYDNRAYAVWSIPGVKGDKTRANIRFSMEDGRGGFTPARTLNEVRDAARFPVIEAMPDGNFLIAWIDRRMDNPKPRQLYLTKIGAHGNPLTDNYSVGPRGCANAASWESPSRTTARQSISSIAKSTLTRSAITCCENPRTAAPASARRWRSATTAAGALLPSFRPQHRPR